MNSYFNTDLKSGIDWNTVGDYSSAFNKPNSGSFSSPSEDKWKDALSKGISWLSGTGKDKYRSQAERQQGSVNFMPRSSGGGSGFQQIAPDASVFIPQQQQPFTVSAPQSSGGLGSTIGGLVGMGGTALGVFGPLGPAAGAAVGGLLPF